MIRSPGFIDLFVLEFPRVRMRNEKNGAPRSGGDRGIECRSAGRLPIINVTTDRGRRRARAAVRPSTLFSRAGVSTRSNSRRKS